MNKVGLLLIRDENDILADTLQWNAQHVDCFYVLDGSEDYKTAEGICMGSRKCAGYWRDVECPYDGPPTDGWRQFLYAKATEDNGYDNWFLLLHGDELWVNEPDAALAEVPDADGFEFRLPFAIPRGWDHGLSAYDQLREFFFPGWPEFRMFKGGEEVYYLPGQHFLTRPLGLKHVVRLDWPILHYPYRSPESQRLRASKSAEWSPENYQAVRERDRVFWDSERIAQFSHGSEHYQYTGIVNGL